MSNVITNCSAKVWKRSNF